MKNLLFKTVSDLALFHKWLVNGQIDDALAKDKVELARIHYSLYTNDYEQEIIDKAFPEAERVKETADGKFYVPKKYTNSGEDEFLKIVNEDKEIEETINNIVELSGGLTIKMETK